MPTAWARTKGKDIAIKQKQEQDNREYQSHRERKQQGKANEHGKAENKDKDMRMSETLPTNNWLNVQAIVDMGGRFTDVISRVELSKMFSRHAQVERLGKVTRGAEVVQPCIYFKTGYRLVPNLGMRRELINRLGDETDRWVGEELTVVIQRHQVTDERTGEILKEFYTRRLEFSDRANPELHPTGPHSITGALSPRVSPGLDEGPLADDREVPRWVDEGDGVDDDGSRSLVD